MTSALSPKSVITNTGLRVAFALPLAAMRAFSNCLGTDGRTVCVMAGTLSMIDLKMDGKYMLSWRTMSLGQAYSSMRNMFPAGASVMIESLDSNSNCLVIQKVLDRLGHGPLFTNDCLTSIEQFDRLDLDDDSIFPGYDAFWVLSPTNEPIERPPFSTFMGAESRTSFPRAKDREANSWEPVFAWMELNGVIAGFARAARTLIVVDTSAIQSDKTSSILNTPLVTGVRGVVNAIGLPSPDGTASKRVRVYDMDGRPLLDVDCGHDHGAGNPHLHRWVGQDRSGEIPLTFQ